MGVEHVARLDEIVQRQHGLITSTEATKVLGPSRKQRWVAEKRLVSIQPGVLRMAGAPDTWHQAVLAAALSTDAVVSHRSAAEMWGLIQPAGYIDISVRPPCQPRLRPPAIAHRILDLHPELALEREGMRVTDPTRTIIDLALVLPIWAVRDAMSRGLSTRLFQISDLEQLREALGRRGRNRIGVVGELLGERLLTARPEERLVEERLADLARLHDLPVLVTQHEVWHAGRFVARVDAAHPELKLAIEVHGYEHHSCPEAFGRDRTRQNRLVALGWTVLRFTWDDVVKHPEMVAQTLRDAIHRLTAA